MRFEIDGKYPNTKGKPDGVLFDIDDGGGQLLFLMDSPTEAEIKNVRYGSIDFALFESRNIIFLLAKFGELNWIDTPYSVHLSKTYKLRKITEGEGLSTLIMLVDTRTETIKTLRLVSFSTEFTRSLFSLIEKQNEKQIENYDANLSYIYATTQTEKMVAQAIAKFSLPEK